MANHCLNCNENVVGNYCSNCGQKTSTHQFSIKHFFVHDFLHGILHLDKGLPYTIKELFTRPGHSIREYVQGKRIKHFNYFATVIFILALDHFVSGWFHIDVAKFMSSSTGFLKVAKEYSKILSFLGVPFYALVSYLMFKKSKQNFTENLVLNIYMLCGWLFIGFLFKILIIFIHSSEAFHTANLFFVAFIHIYISVFYYQYFSAFKYKKISLIIRSILMALIILFLKQQINNLINEIGLRYFH